MTSSGRGRELSQDCDMTSSGTGREVSQGRDTTSSGRGESELCQERFTVS